MLILLLLDSSPFQHLWIYCIAAFSYSCVLVPHLSIRSIGFSMYYIVLGDKNARNSGVFLNKFWMGKVCFICTGVHLPKNSVGGVHWNNFVTVKRHFYAREKCMRIWQNWPLEEFMRILFMRSSTLCTVTYDEIEIYAVQIYATGTWLA